MWTLVPLWALPPPYTEAQIRYSEEHGGGLGSSRTRPEKAKSSAADKGPTRGKPEASQADSRTVHVPSKHPPKILEELGVNVRIQGLKSQPKFNGRIGNVVSWDGGDGHWVIKMADGKGTETLRVRPTNLVNPGGA